MDRIFLSGASGFVGLNIASVLAEHGYIVHAYARSSSNTKYIEQLPVQLFYGDLDDPEALDNAMAGCRYVIHAAGNTSCVRSDRAILWKTNVEGTRQVVDAAIRSGVDRLVYTSTISTIGARNDKQALADESEPLTGFRARSPYAQTKLEAEKLVIKARDKGLETIILNPCAIVGAYDHNLQWGRLILAISRGSVPFRLPGGGSFCGARNQALAHLNALTMGRSGERYIISDVHCDYAEFARCVCQKLNKMPRINNMNFNFLIAMAYLVENLSWLLGKKPFVDSFRMRIFRGHYYFGSAKAQRELNYQPTTLEAMVEEALSWYRANGFIEQ